MHQAAGEYEQLPGWNEDLSDCRDERDLPEAARDYLEYVADFVGVPIVLVGVGPGREQIFWTEAGRAHRAVAVAAAPRDLRPAPRARSRVATMNSWSARFSTSHERPQARRPGSPGRRQAPGDAERTP